MLDLSGHRERLKQRYRNEGLDNFEEHRALELLLFYVIPRKDTAGIARELLNYFGSLEAVLTAPIPSLAAVPGMGESSATYLRIIADFNRYQAVHRNGGIKVLEKPEQCKEYLAPHFLQRREEVLCVLCLDAKCRILGCKIISEGDANSAGLPVRKIVEYALSINATSLFLAHNHPTGISLPSEDDIRTTIQLAGVLSEVGVILVDHFVFGKDGCTSIRECGYGSSF